MALKKSLEINNSGIFCEYWKVHETNINWHNKTARFVLSGFFNQEARESGKNPLISFGYDYNEANFPFSVDENIVAKAYGLVKEPSNEADADGNMISKPSRFADALDIL